MEYSNEFIKMVASKKQLHKFFANLIGDQEQRTITMHSREANLSEVTDSLQNDELFITNADYLENFVDYRLIDSLGRTLLVVSDDGETLNEFSQRDICYNDELSDQLSRLCDLIVGKTICVPSA